jgi:hypothetical protein
VSVETKEIVQDYVLICFDIPQNQGKLRKLVLKKIHDIGGMMHTASVYLLPYGDKAYALAEEIQSFGDVVIWRSHQNDPAKAKTLTLNYASHIETRCQLIEQRFALIQDYLENEQFGRATNMLLKTIVMIEQLKKIADNFKTPWLPGKIAEFEKRLADGMNMGGK